MTNHRARITRRLILNVRQSEDMNKDMKKCSPQPRHNFLLYTILPLIMFAGHSFADGNRPSRMDDLVMGEGPGLVLNAKLTYPQKASLELGLTLRKDRGRHWDASTMGPYVSIEPGISGTKAHLGYGGWAQAGFLPLSVRASASYLRMTQDTLGFNRGDEYVGISLTAGFAYTFNLGIMRSLDDKKEHLVTGGFGIGW